ncbi:MULTISPECIES: glycosyltransferase family 2 protein [Streptomyces]|uniref:Glycosyltransferase n=1 Tax=Streptomyces virginiae TaxID=1961 RepID=A0ABZ1TDD3_STRVG|nr:glycosyltransferase family 2 protein [Streptomyces virginiae]WTB23103.1 glycosyltransferase [Streptomyces virginiae]
MSRFEILLPYYGDVALMQDAVRSVLVQDGDDWRLTVVDDGTEPGVPEWFEQLADPRVRYLRNERDLGVTGNFNRCVELAEYEYLVLMGCDDLMHPNYLQVVRATADREPTAAVIQPGVQVIGTDGLPFDTLGDRTKRKLYAPKGPAAPCWAVRSWPPACCAGTGCTSRRSAGAPRRSSASASAPTSV